MPGLLERQIRLVHELMYQIKVREVMTADVVYFPPTATFREIQRCMKERRFSGTPIATNGEIVGMISIDDIITAFDKGMIDQPVESFMTRDVTTIPQNYSVVSASNLFNKFGYGRLPVVKSSRSRQLVGILTYSDILSNLLIKVNAIAERVEERENSYDRVLSQKKSGESLHFELRADNYEMAGMASTTTKKHLVRHGILPATVRRIAVICYEAEMNVILHSLGGYMNVDINDDFVRVEVGDEGPGIPDLEQALKPGYTTANEKIRALGFGAGMGLCNIKRCADEFNIQSVMETGTELVAVVYLKPTTTTDSEQQKAEDAKPES